MVSPQLVCSVSHVTVCIGKFVLSYAKIASKVQYRIVYVLILTVTLKYKVI